VASYPNGALEKRRGTETPAKKDWPGQGAANACATRGKVFSSPGQGGPHKYATSGATITSVPPDSKRTVRNRGTKATVTTRVEAGGEDMGDEKRSHRLEADAAASHPYV
jgi:hypothetical protein